MARIVFDITGQGYGHLSQIGPVIKEVRALSPQTTIIVGSHFPEEALTRFAGAPIERRLPPPEASVVTVGPMRFDSQATIATYRELHSDFPALVRSEASRLALVKPDLLVAASSYVSLAAASRLEIPTVALGSFSWLDAFEAYCSEMPEAGRIAAEIEAAYGSATIFLHPRPHVAPRFANALSIGPIGRIGLDLRAEVRRLIGVPRTCGLRWFLSAAFRIRIRSRFHRRPTCIGFCKAAAPWTDRTMSPISPPCLTPSSTCWRRWTWS